mmetsp:Transcript_85115/g.170303  ORF Transcript_85115/g.170303 Transcript_85115/m.170303 type:complete len:213 (-) Transcript_85115:280-918(-)
MPWPPLNPSWVDGRFNFNFEWTPTPPSDNFGTMACFSVSSPRSLSSTESSLSLPQLRLSSPSEESSLLSPSANELSSATDPTGCLIMDFIEFALLIAADTNDSSSCVRHHLDDGSPHTMSSSNGAKVNNRSPYNHCSTPFAVQAAALVSSAVCIMSKNSWGSFPSNTTITASAATAAGASAAGVADFDGLGCGKDDGSGSDRAQSHFSSEQS